MRLHKQDKLIIAVIAVLLTYLGWVMYQHLSQDECFKSAGHRYLAKPGWYDCPPAKEEGKNPLTDSSPIIIDAR